MRSLAIDDADRIYVGAVGDFGYLEPDASGRLLFRSLRDRVPENARAFNDVWRTFVTPSGVLFATEQVIFRWASDAVQVLTAPSRLNRASLVDGQLYVTLPESGLNVLEGDRFRVLPGTAALAREVYPVVLRYDETRLIVGTRSNGLFLYDGAALTPFATELDGFLKTANLYRGVVLPDRTIALATTGGGLGIIDRQGRRVAVVDRDGGLPSNAVYYVTTDREGAVWVALERGLARIETPSPASYFDARDGFLGAFGSIRHEGTAYIAWQSGVSYLHPRRPETRRGPRRSRASATSAGCSRS